MSVVVCSNKRVFRSVKHLFFVFFLATLGCGLNRLGLCGTDPTGEFCHIEAKGIENFYSLGDAVYSGSTPQGEEGFGNLQKLGVQTVISVDGAAPEVDLAAKFGMRYVHLPVGYDGITRSNALRIVRAAQVLPRGVFVHCHRGSHRGPTAAALICEVLQGWSSKKAEAWLKVAGTDTNYPGLYRTVREFAQPTAAELRGVRTEFSARAQTPALVETMVQIDHHYDILKGFQKAGFRNFCAHPDLTPASEALLLSELFREAHRTKQGAERGEGFYAELNKAATVAENLHARLKNSKINPVKDSDPAEAAFQSLTDSCASCHKAYRN